MLDALNTYKACVHCPEWLFHLPKSTQQVQNGKQARSLRTLDFPGGSESKECACSAGDPGSLPGQEDPLEEDMATHSSILAWRIPRTVETGRL